MENITNTAVPDALIAINLTHLNELLQDSTIGGSSLMITSSYERSTGELSKYDPASSNKMTAVLVLNNGKPNGINVIKFEGAAFGENTEQTLSDDEITAMVSVLRLVHGDSWNSPENIKDLRVKLGETAIDLEIISEKLSKVKLG